MSQLKYSAYDGVGKHALEEYYYSQAVRVPPNRVECSGQGGWDPTNMEVSADVDAQITQAFANIDLTLRTAGVENGFESVFSIKSYHVGALDEVVFESMKKNMQKWMPGHRPIWTMLGVTALGLPAMRVEIDVVAIDGKEE
ncbi:hypothetical protein LTR91_020478 [Friedmanniomyces endolithicus]|uniref:Uncharacterized protein n=1 Tax=Friedmanniomyces endolithicus TaxID=329885 RepID=A0AAN6H8R0_9PEZI|nr:hypothetical protein LTR94_021703 [Friedmanniomyces endolithicus]KAK0769279.1 hypothetical protein LTR59_017130 [Friedmanniomyces endolithicus]KAK0776013.1 hypothetical protein LTR38_015646 [Friedmanniomyces endolithicus]KAK0777023.1 hypothetical protein LTR75_016072 [Friedmanniomyces endolithicus]KAK0830711.1 hypothetical protein LTR03_015740 [Friedmanniomyces endolithicus]